jgi:hypothetical protein
MSNSGVRLKGESLCDALAIPVWPQLGHSRAISNLSLTSILYIWHLDKLTPRLG